MMKREDNLFSNTRWWDIPSVILIIILLTITSSRLLATKWTANLNIVQFIAYFGIIAGLALGYSQFREKTCLFFALIYGTFFIIWQLGVPIGHQIAWQERLYIMWVRLSVIIRYLYEGKPVPDNFLFLLLMGLLFWSISIYAGYSLIRYADAWRIVLPAGLAIVVIHSYDIFIIRRIFYLIGFLFFSTILIARLSFLHNKFEWNKTRTYLPPHIEIDILRITLISALIILLISWVIPVRANALHSAENAWYKIKQPFENIINSFDNAFASLKSSVGIVNDYYSNTIILGHGNRLSDKEIFTVIVPDVSPIGNRFYWRVRVFDLYEDSIWTSTLNITKVINPESTELKFYQYKNRIPNLFSFYFTPAQPISLLYSAAQPEWVSRQIKAEVLFNPDGTVDLAAIKAYPYIRLGESYSVQSSISGATVKQMRQSDTEYPEYINNRYLQLPTSISELSRQLAITITQDTDNPYDKVMAITNYLRSNIEYIDQIEELPKDQELIDWFLFEGKKGYCNYYATAEVILLRSIGIPARLAVGYAQGEPQREKNAYIVRQKDAHAWPEVYFEDLGWIEFEPTTSQPELHRPSGELRDIDNFQQINPLEELNPRERPQSSYLYPQNESQSHLLRINHYVLILICIIIALIILIILSYLHRTHKINIPTIPQVLEFSFQILGIKPPMIVQHWARMNSLPEISKAYSVINLSLTQLGNAPKGSDTPLERSVSLTQIIPEIKPSSKKLVNEYQISVYSNMTGDLYSAKIAASKIRLLALRKKLHQLFRIY